MPEALDGAALRQQVQDKLDTMDHSLDLASYRMNPEAFKAAEKELDAMKPVLDKLPALEESANSQAIAEVIEKAGVDTSSTNGMARALYAKNLAEGLHRRYNMPVSLAMEELLEARTANDMNRVAGEIEERQQGKKKPPSRDERTSFQKELDDIDINDPYADEKMRALKKKYRV